MISIAILPFGFLMQVENGEEKIPVAMCNTLTEDEAYRLSFILSSVGNILAKGGVNILLEEGIANKIETNLNKKFAIDPKHLN